MRPIHLIFSAVHLLIALVVLAAGVFFIGLSRAPHVRIALSEFFSQPHTIFSFLGYLIVAIGAGLLIGFYGLHRKSFLRLQMHAQPASIDLKLVRDYVESYWKRRFPDHATSLEVHLSRGQKVEVVADFPSIEGKPLERSLQEIEKELGTLLARNLGYHRDFFVTLMFKPD